VRAARGRAVGLGLALGVALGVALALAAATACVGGSKGTGGAASEAGTDAVADGAAAADAARATLVVDAAAPDPIAMAARGKTLYGKYCSFCHGAEGKGYAADEAPALASDDLLALATDDFLRDAIFKGRPGTTMSAWAVIRGGPLGHDDASALVAYLRTWQTRPSERVTERTLSPSASAERGAAIYAAHCKTCHGAKGRDGKHNALANPELLASASDGFLATTIERGRAGTPMQGFRGKLTSEQIDDVIALLRSWQKAPDPTPDLPPKPGGLVSVVLSPRGPQPAFDAKADFIPADTVKREVDRKATMIIIDARPPGDYARMHIAGAISTPFYDVEAYAKQIPKDRYILTYCACPHAESVKVRNALRGLGYPRVAVIDEGILAWRDRGYPVRGGPRP